MKKRYFNFKLYIDALKQLRLIGIISLVILILQAVLIPIGNNISAWSNLYTANYSGSMLSYNTFMPLCFCIVAPLMTLYLFNFLNKRNGSDFYLSFPDTRICLSFSFYMAIITWLAVIILATSGVSLVTVSLMDRCTLEMDSVLRTVLNIFAGSVFVSAATFMAMNITGTNLSNIIVALLIIFLPRTLTVLVMLMNQSLIPFIAFDISDTLFANKYNVVSDAFISVIFAITPSFSFTSTLISGVYTLIVGVIYSILGIVLFNCRKSESAGNPALNKWVQLIIRTVISMMICIIPLYGIIKTFILHTDSDANTSNRIFTIIVFYIIAIVVYFLYELITTKKWINVIKAVPGLIVLVVLNIVLGVAIVAGYNIALRNPINENNIEYVQVADQDYENMYFKKQYSKIKLNDASVNKIVSDTLNRTIENWKQNRSIYDTENGVNFNRTVKIKANGKIYSRVISMTEQEYQTVENILLSQPEYLEILKQAPSLEKVSIQNNLGISINADELANVYNTFREEIQTASLTLSDLISIYDLEYSKNEGHTLYVYFNADNNWSVFGIKIDNRLPKTSALWNQYIQNAVSDRIVNKKQIDNNYNTILSQEDMLAKLNQFVQNNRNNTNNSNGAGDTTTNGTNGSDVTNSSNSTSGSDNINNSVSDSTNNINSAEIAQNLNIISLENMNYIDTRMKFMAAATALYEENQIEEEDYESEIDLNFYYYTNTGFLEKGNDVSLSMSKDIADASDVYAETVLDSQGSHSTFNITNDVDALAEFIPCLQNNLGAKNITYNDVIVEVIILQGSLHNEQMFIVPKDQISEAVAVRFGLTYR